MALSLPELPSDLSAVSDERLSEAVESLDAALKKLRAEKAKREGKSSVEADLDTSDPVALKKFLISLKEEVTTIKSSVSKPSQPAAVDFVAYVASSGQETIDDEKKTEWSSQPDRPSWSYPQPNPKDPWLYYI
jgi:hypothetical protein